MAKPVPKAAWQNRIVGSGTENPDQLLAHDKNWRVHPKSQQNAMAAVFERVGWVQSVIVNQRTGKLVDGHMRVAMALSKHEPKIPVVYVDLSPEEEDVILATLDPLGDLAATDRAQLAELLTEIDQQDGLGDEISALLTEIRPAEEPGRPLVDLDVGKAALGIEQLVFYVSSTDAEAIRAKLAETKEPSDSEALVRLLLP
jgi:hypothetical protein